MRNRTTNYLRGRTWSRSRPSIPTLIDIQAESEASCHLTEAQAAIIMGMILNGNLPPRHISSCDNTAFFVDLRLLDIFLAMRTLAYQRKASIVNADLVMRHLRNEVWITGNKQRIEEYSQLIAKIQSLASLKGKVYGREQDIDNAE